MLETVRQYAWQQLEHAGETAALRDRHLRWCVLLAEQAAPALRGREQGAWLVRLEREHDNLLAALRWSMRAGADAAAGLRVAGDPAALWAGAGRRPAGRARAAAGGAGAQ